MFAAGTAAPQNSQAEPGGAGDAEGNAGAPVAATTRLSIAESSLVIAANRSQDEGAGRGVSQTWQARAAGGLWRVQAAHAHSWGSTKRAISQWGGGLCGLCWLRFWLLV